MKARVVKRYVDKNTNLLHEIGQEVEITTERFEGINSSLLGIFVEEIKKQKVARKKVGG